MQTQKILFLFTIFLLISLFDVSNSQAQQTERERGIALYNEGNNKEAIKALKNAVKKTKDDVEAWNYLGLAFNREGKYKDARSAFEKTVALRPQSVMFRISLGIVLVNLNKLDEAKKEIDKIISLDTQSSELHLLIAIFSLRKNEPEKAYEAAETALKINPKYADALLIRNKAAIELYAQPISQLDDEKESKAEHDKRAGIFKKAVDDTETFLKSVPNARQINALKEQLDTLQFFYGYLSGNSPILRSSDVAVKARITFKPQPEYPVEARRNQVSGIVRVIAVLSFTGKVENVRVIKGLPDGLTEAAVNATRRIKFIPARIDGKPVSQWVTLEYSFRIY